MEILRRGNSIKNSTEPVRNGNTDEVIFFNYVNNETKSLGNNSLLYAVDDAFSNFSSTESQEHDTWSSENENIFACDRKNELGQLFEDSSGDNGSLPDVSDYLTSDSTLMTDDIVKGLCFVLTFDTQIQRESLTSLSNAGPSPDTELTQNTKWVGGRKAESYCFIKRRTFPRHRAHSKYKVGGG